MKQLSRAISAGMIAVVALLGLNPTQAHAGNPDDSRKAAVFTDFLKQRRDARTSTRLGAGGAGEFSLNENLRTRPANIMRANAMNPRGNVYGVIPTYTKASSYSDALYAKISLADGKVSTVYNNPVFIINEMDYYYESAALRDNILYIPNYTQNMVTSELSIFWDRFNVATGEVLEPLMFPSSEYNAFCYSLAYNPSEDMFYGLSLNITNGTMGELVKIDPKTWKVTDIGNVGSASNDCMVAIAYCSADGQLYGLKDDGSFSTINTSTARTSIVRQFDDYDDYFLFPEEQTPVPLVYDPVDHCFVTIFRDSSAEMMRIAFIDYAGGEFQPMLGNDLEDIYFVAALISTDEYADDDAPGLPAIDKVEFNGSELKGNITFTAPELTYNDIKLPGNVNAIMKIDGSQVYSSSVKPGATVTVPVTVAQGEHTVTVTCEINKLTGPTASYNFYAGFDNPMPPTALKLDGATLTWKKSADTGVHNGYLNAAGITYDVYVDGEKSNTRPLVDCKYDIPQPAKMKRAAITVVAKADGVSSDPSEALSAVIGKALPLPYTFVPTREEAELLTFENSNKDENEFGFYSQGGKDYIAIRTAQYYQQVDDWLFLPLSSFTDTQCLYNLSFMYSNAYGNALHYDTMDIFLGDKPTEDAMNEGKYIYGHVDEKNPEETLLSATFSIDKPGDYVIGIHTMGGESGLYRGIKISDLNLSALQGSSVKAPASPTDIKVVAAPEGELKAVISFTAPTQDIAGNSLSGNMTMRALCGDKESLVTVAPGEKSTISVEVAESGFSRVTLTPANSFGSGIPRYYRCYVGLDAPTAPLNIKGIASEDNMSYTLTWDAPTEGVNGGYVDPKGLTYDIYTHPTTNAYYKVGFSTTNSFVYTPVSQTQEPVLIGPVAKNELGESKYSNFAYEFIGKPLELPFKEEFSNKAAGYPLWKFSSDSKYTTEWATAASLSAYGVGNGAVIEGVLVASNPDMGNALGRLFGPKFSTKGLDKVSFELIFWNYARAAKMEVWGRSSKRDEPFKIASLSPSDGHGSWDTFSAELPADLLDCGWAQLYVDVDLNPGGYFFMESFKVTQDYDYDFKIYSIEGNGIYSVGENAEYLIDAVNSGLEASTAILNVELFGDGNRLALQSFSIGRTLPSNTHQQKVSVPMLVEYLAYKDLELKATVVAPKDEISFNNTMSAKITLSDNVLPIVEDLKAEWTDDAHRAANISWGKPEATYGNLEGFESIPEFRITDKIGNWKNIDGDKKEQFVFSADNMRWDGDSDPSAWTVYNPSVLGTQNESRLKTHSGSQYLMARSIAYDVTSESPKQNQDWLISPEVVGGSTVTFWMNILDSTYPETIDIWYSTTDDTIGEIEYMATKGAKAGSFTKLAAFTKSGTDLWEQIKFTLPANTKYFAFVYCSIGGFGACIDDVDYTPAKLAEWNVESYNLYRTVDSKREKIASEITALSYADANLSDTNVTYHVTTNIISDGVKYESPVSNAARIWQTGVEEISGSALIAGGKGVIAIEGMAGAQAAVYTIDGKFLKLSDLRSDTEYISCEPGVYLVKVGDAVAKVLVK